MITIKRTKLFCDNNGDAPIGTEYFFNILENHEFNAAYGHMHYRNFPMYAIIQCDKWNKRQPNNWRYEVVA